MVTKQVTINELSKSINHDYQTTSALVKILVGIGAAKEIGKRPQVSGRGKPSSIFEINNEIDLVIWPELVETESIEEENVLSKIEAPVSIE